MNKKKIVGLLFLILLLGGILRFYNLGAKSFVTDEFLDINSAYGYFKTNTWLAWDFNLNRVSDDLFAPRDERAWMYKWQVAQIFHIFPATEAVARSISVVWGLISILLLYFIGKYFTGRKEIGLIAAFLFAVSTSGIMIDRTLRMYAMFFPIFLLFSWFLFRFLEETYAGKNKLFKKIQKIFGFNTVWFLPVLFVGLISWNIHNLTINVSAIFILYCIIQSIVFFYQNKSFKNKYVFWLILLTLSICLGYLIFPEFFKKYLSGLKFFKFNTHNISGAVSDYINPILAYLFIFGGSFFLFKDRLYQKKVIWLLSCFFGIILAATTMWKIGYGIRLIFFSFSFGIILTAAGIYFFVNYISEKNKKNRSLIFGIILGLILIILPNYYDLFFKKNIYKTETDSHREVFEILKKQATPGDFLITRNFRNYYFAGENLKIYNIGKQEDIDLDTLKKIMLENERVWGVFGDGKGYFKKDAYKMFQEKFKMVYESEGENIYKFEK